MIFLLLVLIVWVALSYFLYTEGNKREIGGAVAFLLSFLFSPFVGFIVVALSKPLHLNSAHEKETSVSDELNSIIADELTKLKRSYDNGEIDLLEYSNKKSILLSKYK